MTALQEKAWKIGVHEAHTQKRIVPACQSKEMMQFIKATPRKTMIVFHGLRRTITAWRLKSECKRRLKCSCSFCGHFRGTAPDKAIPPQSASPTQNAGGMQNET